MAWQNDNSRKNTDKQQQQNKQTKSDATMLNAKFKRDGKDIDVIIYHYKL